MNLSYPEKIYIELTTRCNLHCRMCVKYAEGSRIEEGDLPISACRSLLSTLPHVRELVLNGIGEPLLHPQLEEIIRQARFAMVPEATIGFQSNGLLIDIPRACSLIEAGLSTLCLSLDSLQTDPSGNLGNHNGEHAFSRVVEAVGCLNQAKRKLAAEFRIGIETVLSRENIDELPAIVRWAVDRQIDYLICTHLIPYDKQSESLTLFNPNAEDAVRIFKKYSDQAAEQDIALEDCLTAYHKFSKTERELQAIKLLGEIRQEFDAGELRLNLTGLLETDYQMSAHAEKIFAQAEDIAAAGGLELMLPPLRAKTNRSCRFIDDKAVFIAANGDIVPCHFLWHTYSSRVLGGDIEVQPRVFGNLQSNTLEEVWQNEKFQRFREEAGQSVYAPCWSCSQGPCPTLVNDRGDFANDCFGSRVPCGHCQWNLGGIRCL